MHAQQGLEKLLLFLTGETDAAAVYTIHMEKEKFTVVSRPDDESHHMASTVKTVLEQHGYIKDDENPDTVFVVGGDGTFIFAVHMYMNRVEQTKFYGIHTGTLGFYTDYRSSDLDEFLNAYLENKVAEEKFPLLEAKYEKGILYGLNEVRIENAARTQDMRISVNGKIFENYRGTGILICTQLGSTAYNRSLGGAVVQEGVPVIEMSEISGIHHHMYRSLGAPFIMRDDVVIDLESESYEGALLGVDSEVYNMDEMKHVTVKKSEKQVRMLRGRKISYFERLRTLF